MTQINPQDLIDRLTCKVCGGNRVTLKAGTLDYETGEVDTEPCPNCTNLDDERGIIQGIVRPLTRFQNYMSGGSEYNPNPVNHLAQAFVNLAEFCALREIEPDKGGAELHEVTSVKDAINLATTNLSLVPKREWAWLMFSMIQSLADGANLDLAGAVEEVMKDKEAEG